MFAQQGGSDTHGAVDSTGRTAAFEEDGCNRLALGQKQSLSGSADKGIAGILVVITLQDLGLAFEDCMSVSVHKFCSGSWCGQAAQLLRAEGDPMAVLQDLQAGCAGLAQSVISTGEAKQAGTDQIERRLLHHRILQFAERLQPGDVDYSQSMLNR